MKVLPVVLLRKIPSVRRSLTMSKIAAVAAAMASTFVVSLASGQNANIGAPLRESDVIRLARDAAPGALIAEAQEKTADLELRAAGLHPNPALVFARESVKSGPQAGRGSQDLFGVNVPIDVARPRAERALLASQSAWRRVEASLARTEAILQAVLAYYEVGLAEARVVALSSAVENLEEAARVLERRKAAGTVSGYERARLNIEKELGQSQLTEAQALAQAARIYLAVLLGRDARSLDVEVDLSLRAPENAEMPGSGSGEKQDSALNTKEFLSISNESMRRAHESESLSRKASDRASLTWFPEIELGAGVKRANNAGSADGFGYFVGANLSLPFFDRGQGERARAEAEQVMMSARSEALGRNIAAEVQSTLIGYRRASEELERFDQATSQHIEELLSAVQGGYREGERTIVELLDAQRARTEVTLRHLSLLATAKRAEVRLRSATGELK